MKPQLGPCIYRAQDGVSDYAAIVTLVDFDGQRYGCSVTVFPPSQPPQFYTRIAWETSYFANAKPGTCRPVGT